MPNTNKSAAIQFFDDIDEPVVPEIRVTRGRDGKTGQAIFVFEEPKALSSETIGDITGMTMIDQDGILKTKEVNARFLNGTPSAIEATYTWKTEADFERFMRFAKSYAKVNGLGYTESSKS